MFGWSKYIESIAVVAIVIDPGIIADPLFIVDELVFCPDIHHRPF